MRATALVAGALLAAMVIWSLAATPPGPTAAAGARPDRAAAAGEPAAASADPAAARPAPAAAAPEEVRLASLYGRVLDEAGGPVAGVVVVLTDAGGEPLDEGVTAADGRYEVADPRREGRALVVEGAGEAAVREVNPLGPGEARQVDIVLGATREVVGWVLDLAGDPLPGAAVTLEGQAAGARWTTLTDGGGGFRFPDAPATPVRVEADAGPLGRAGARLAGSAAARREVTLVVEPTGTLVVLTDGEDEGEVVVRCWDRRFHGADPLFADVLEPEAPPAPAEAEALPEEADALEPPPDPDLDAVLAAVEGGLRTWDGADPEGSMTRVVLAVMGVAPELARPPGWEGAWGADPEREARELARTFLAQEPAVAARMGLVATAVKAGAGLMEAVQHLEEAPGADGPPPAPAAPPPAPAADGGPWDGPEALPEAEDLAGGDLAGDDLARVPTDADPRAVVARGRPGEPIPLRGAFDYAVELALPDGTSRPCGSVFLDPGEQLVLHCGSRPAPAVVGGRVVDEDGSPLPGLRVSVLAPGAADDAPAAVTDAAGRFEAATRLSAAALAEVMAVDPSGERAPALRRGVNLLPGGRAEIGDLVARRPEDLPERWSSEPLGGVGGLVRLDPMGAVLDDVEDDVPLALAGAEPGDTVVAIDGAPAAELPMDEVLLRLRGEVGTSVGVRLRTAAGELVDLLLTRDVVPPATETWPGVAPGPQAFPHAPHDE